MNNTAYWFDFFVGLLLIPDRVLSSRAYFRLSSKYKIENKNKTPFKPLKKMILKNVH